MLPENTLPGFAVALSIGVTVYLSIQQRNFDNIGAGRATGSAWTAGFAQAAHLSVPKMVHTAEIKEAKALDLTVLAWTVNVSARMAEVMDMGVDGIVIDRPDLLRMEMQRRGLPLPLATPVRAD
jgi:glycerophosphoryl diester phosphodiesterase